MTLTTQKEQIIMKSNKSQPRQQQQNIIHSYQLRSTKPKMTTATVTDSTQQLKKPTLSGLEKTCGLFNIEQIQMLDTGTKETEINKSNQMISLFEGSRENLNDEKLGDLNELFFDIDNTNLNSYENFNNAQTPLNSSIDSGELNFEKTSDLVEILNCEESLIKKPEVFNIKSSLMKRVENLNMKIEVKKTPINRQDSFNFQFDDVHDLITPTIQFISYDPTVTNICHDFLKSLPTPQINTSDLLNMDFQTPQSLNKSYSNEINPFIKSMSAAIELNKQKSKEEEQLNKILIGSNEIQNQISVEAISLDHDYTSPISRKRKNSINDDTNSNSDFNEITNQVLPFRTKKSKAEVALQKPPPLKKQTSRAGSVISTNGGKRKRIKGIYRANDVTSREELENYLERRRKNNISSKQSRLTKKTLYVSMDEKANQLERENEGLKQTITNLESLTQLLKDVLLQRFTTNIK